MTVIVLVLSGVILLLSVVMLIAGKRLAELFQVQLEIANVQLERALHPMLSVSDTSPRLDAGQVDPLDALGGFDLVYWSFSYYLGRSTIQTSAFAGALAGNWDSVPDNIRALIQRDLDASFVKDDQQRAAVETPGNRDPCDIYTLGQLCDRRGWELVRACYRSEEVEPKGEDVRKPT